VLVVGGVAPGPCPATVQLERRGYALQRVLELPAGLAPTSADVIILALPRGQDDRVIQHCADLRRLAWPAVIVLHQGADSEFVVRALEAGADDCLPSPHGPREVVARVTALLRRRARDARRYGGRHCVFDGHELDALTRIVRAPDGRQVEITELQHRLLSALLARPGEVVDREELLEHVLGEETESFDRAIDVHVSRLKKRLATVSDADLISCYRGVGYRLDVQHVAQ